MQPEHIKGDSRSKPGEIRLRLRWDRSPVLPNPRRHVADPEQVFHAKYANNEVYVIVEPEILPPPNGGRSIRLGRPPLHPVALWTPHPEGVEADRERGLLDLAYFYDRASGVQNRPFGPVPGTIVATAVDLDAVGAACCGDVWFKGAFGQGR
jgi:hypothetical protein